MRGETTFRPRVLLVAEAANPEMVSVPLEGWSHTQALARICDAHVVTQVRNRDAWIRAGVSESAFTAIDSERIAKPIYQLSDRLRGGKGKGWTTVMALNLVSYRYFEKLVWERFEDDLLARRFDLVHRITPLSPTIPSSLGIRCAKAGVPFVMGPLNGGVPWPKAFDGARRREREWLSYVRGLHRFVPGYRATRRAASAILCGSADVYGQMPSWAKERCFYIPENAVDPARFNTPIERETVAVPIRVAFVGRLVPYKGADMLLEAAAPLIRAGSVVIDVVGDGPEMPGLRDLVRREGIESGVTFAGWVDHTKLQDRLKQSDVFGFPSVREFGGAVVLEAMALGLVPIVVAYGGPGELVTPATGVAVPIGGRESIVAGVRAALEGFVADPQRVRRMGRLARQRVLRHFTWDAKALQVKQVYAWVLGRSSERPGCAMPIPDDAAPAFGIVQERMVPIA